jgi:hypothetical protein
MILSSSSAATLPGAKATWPFVRERHCPGAVVVIWSEYALGRRESVTKLAVRHANDPSVLLAVDGPENEAKGDDDASEWLPENRRFACGYVATQIFIKTEYRLWVTRAEHDAMVATLDDCGADPKAPKPRSRTLRP